ncbi:hypothetical protein CHS0354_009893 [Potamilus streckersoni]|uniref:Peptidase M12B domain-containing protein n=1 Tax=Potamilus streckersoni TaxID=2493646 RepID=A0AAE0VQ98_9BIVA|nr:hypothetical protein CHS0354_009893 [Potamilus streckersoni]
MTHTLGASHDGEGDAKDCKAEDLFIMSPIKEGPSSERPYSRNPWLFSNCSVEAFKVTLRNKICLKSPGSYFDQEEYAKYTSKQPGEMFTVDEQCELIHGSKSSVCEIALAKYGSIDS